MHKFPIDARELADLMQVQLKHEEQQEHLNKHGNIEGLCAKLKVDPKIGLKSDDKDDLNSRILHFGQNEIPKIPSKSFIHLIWEGLQDKTLIILMVSAIVSLTLSFYQILSQPNNEESSKENINLDWVEGLAILFTVMAIVLVVAFNDWSKERQFRGLQSKIDSDQGISVLRSGQIIQLPVKDILVGDICQIFYGHLIPADGLVVESNDLKVDESSLTGETNLIKKSVERPMLFSGTHVMEGSAKMLVTAVGINSQSGIIMSLLGANKKQSLAKKKDRKIYDEEIELREKLQYGEMASYLGTVISILTIIILTIRFFINQYSQEKNFSGPVVISALITILVVAVPEGLPLAVTISFAYAVKKMMKDNNLVRHLDA
ncbi:plasma membrane calcium-transporting ATPase 3 isoform X2, partial [Brachionus plicatilis]